MKDRGETGGYVLVIVLVVLTVAGTILAATARYLGRQTLEAGIAQRELQVKWGTLGCAAVCLPMAEQILRGGTPKANRACASIDRTIALGDVTFRLVFGDEQAKANVNMLAHRFGKDVAAAGIARLESQTRRAVQVRLRPGQVAPETITKIPVRYATLDQVFVLDHPCDLIGPESDEPSALDRITCWGSGKVNFRTADVSVIRQVAAGLLTEDELLKLVELRDSTPGCTLMQAVADLRLKHDRMGRLTEVLTDTSRCYSLWVIAKGGQRDRYRLYVNQLGDLANDWQRWTFQW